MIASDSEYIPFHLQCRFMKRITNFRMDSAVIFKNARARSTIYDCHVYA